MTVKSCEKVEKSQVALTIEVNAAEFEAAVEKAYQKMRRKISVPGFRPGKAPRKMIERMYGAEVFFEEAINIAFPEAYEAAAEQEKLQIVGYPTVEMVGEVTKDGFTFKATTPVYPEVTLGEYKGLKAEKPEVKVLAADVDERLKALADRNTRLVSVEREAKSGRHRCHRLRRLPWMASLSMAARARTTIWSWAPAALCPVLRSRSSA